MLAINVESKETFSGEYRCWTSRDEEFRGSLISGVNRVAGTPVCVIVRVSIKNRALSMCNVDILTRAWGPFPTNNLDFLSMSSHQNPISTFTCRPPKGLLIQPFGLG